MQIYVYNPDTTLYYAVYAAIETQTGLVTLSTSQSGVSADPGYVPSEGDPICPISFYIVYFNLDPATVDGNQFTVTTNAVTHYIERYTCDTWVDETVPEDLMVIAANMIRDRINEADGNKDVRLKSESVKNYSYTINDTYLNQSIYTKYNFELDMFRIIPFA